MAISEQPSKLSLPQKNPGVSTVLEYLVMKFPRIPAALWQRRVSEGKVHFHDGSLVTRESPFIPQQRIYYYREVESEPSIPFQEEILFQDEHLLVAYKPHFLALTPGGIFVNECLQTRLRQRTGVSCLQALHRLDRVTAGLVMFSTEPRTRARYHHLFETRQISKIYQAVAQVPADANLQGREWVVKNRIERAQPRFRMQVVAGPQNSHSTVRCIAQRGVKALFELSPVTGKTHQLRLHMAALGWPILNDKYYPQLQPLSADDFAAPLQLLAKQLSFIDPITEQQRIFNYPGHLPW